jgi:hypothetical protein
MQKFRVYFATKFHVTTTWFRQKKDVTETEYVVVTAHNEAHATKEAKKHVRLDALGLPFEVTHIEPAPIDEPEGYHGTQFHLDPQRQEPGEA